MRKVVLVLAVLTLPAAACSGERARSGASPSPSGPRRVAVTAVDYAFEGIPQTIAAGETTFTMRNDGEVPHQLSMGLITGDQSIEELIRLPEKQGDKVIEEVRAINEPVASGATGEATVTLQPGRYGYVCFVGAGTGRPHAFEGMLGEFTVE